MSFNCWIIFSPKSWFWHLNLFNLFQPLSKLYSIISKKNSLISLLLNKFIAVLPYTKMSKKENNVCKNRSYMQSQRFCDVTNLLWSDGAILWAQKRVQREPKQKAKIFIEAALKDENILTQRLSLANFIILALEKALCGWNQVKCG